MEARAKANPRAVDRSLDPTNGAPSLQRLRDTVEGPAPQSAHRRIAVDVVPDQAHRLLERPRLAALPLQVVAAQCPPERVARAPPQQVPGAHQIQRGVGGAEAARVQYAGE